jgi:8-oxo-dGTP pyrophosphatase MutT (NUDIX family)
MTGSADTQPFLTAATLLLVRDANDAIEVFMVRRPGAADFGGMYVFPGGKLDAADGAAAHLSPTLTDAEASRRLGIERGGLAYWVAAIRESFEEAGVLLARRSGHDAATVTGTVAEVEARFGEYRHAMLNGQVTLADLCDAEGLELAADEVHYFSHWITPPGPPRRYDTRFFIARMPENQRLAHHEAELTDGCWVRPSVALENHAQRHWQMIMPTLSTLRTLARFAGVDALLDAVRGGTHLPPVTDDHGRQGMQPTSTRRT